MGSKNKEKRFFRRVHLYALLFLTAYTIISKLIFARSVSQPNIYMSFFIPYLFGFFAGVGLLYLLNHEDFFHFIKDVEKIEEEKEKKFLKKFRHTGKLITTFLIATIGGPIFSAITIRLFFGKSWYKYLLVGVGNIFSTILTVGTAKGLFALLFF